MSVSNIRKILIAIIFFGYIFLLTYLVWLWSISAFDFDEFTTTVAIILPIMASHVTHAVQFSYSKDILFEEKTKFPIISCAIALTLPFGLIVFLAFSLYIKGFNKVQITFEQFKILIALINSMFGVYVAFIVKSYLRISSSNLNRRSSKTS